MKAIQKEIMEPRAAEYLYDLEKDKWETNNLAFLPEYKNIVQEMRSVLKEHLIQTRDANFIPQYTLDGECSVSCLIIIDLIIINIPLKILWMQQC